MAINIKNTPKYFLNVTTFSIVDIFDPTIAPIIPKIHMGSPILKFIFLFLIKIIIAAIAVGTKNITFVACAICCSIPRNSDNNRISIVPPPIPNPLTIPDINPIKISFILTPK